MFEFNEKAYKNHVIYPTGTTPIMTPSQTVDTPLPSWYIGKNAAGREYSIKASAENISLYLYKSLLLFLLCNPTLVMYRII